MPGTRKLGRPTAHRMSMLKGMVTYLLEKGQIETTVTRAKEVSALTDKMITLGKKNTLAAKRQAMSFLKKESVVYKLFTTVAPLYSDRDGGYTKVLKTGPRRGDGAEMAVIIMVEANSVYAPDDKKAKKAKAEAEKKEKSKETAKTTEKKPKTAEKPKLEKAEPKEEEKPEVKKPVRTRKPAVKAAVPEETENGEQITDNR